jgi:hypothetical protein
MEMNCTGAGHFFLQMARAVNGMYRGHMYSLREYLLKGNNGSMKVVFFHGCANRYTGNGHIMDCLLWKYTQPNFDSIDILFLKAAIPPPGILTPKGAVGFSCIE